VNRREVLAAGAAAGAALALPQRARAAGEWSRTFDFAASGSGDGWPGWACIGVANLRRADGHGLLEAGSDVFPCDPRPVAFAVDARFRDGTITAVISATGAGAGVVLRRVAPREYYAAILDDEQQALIVVRRSPTELHELARAPWSPSGDAVSLSFSAAGSSLTAVARDVGPPVLVQVDDEALMRAGDVGVLATARTLFPSSGGPVPALGNIHLLPYGVQEGEAFLDTPVGEQLLAEIRERSTAVFASITISTGGRPGPTLPSVIAATNGMPVPGGGQVRVASDVPARVEIEFARNPNFKRSRRLRAASTDGFGALVAELRDVVPNPVAGERVYWRARLERKGRVVVGPTRSFKPLPPPGSAASATIAIAACASQFGPIFDHLLARKPDAFVWQGDLNYPDTIGPLAQSMSGYAGVWRDFLTNPRLTPLLEQSLFAPQRDDHDYGVQDANSTNLVPWGIKPWESLMQPKHWYRFTAGVAEFWVLNQRHWKSDPKLPDTPAKTLLGMQQRDWLLKGLAKSRAKFKVICSPCTVAPLPANGRDGSWATGFTAERDLLLRHVTEHVSGQAIFVTGDTHWTMVYDKDGLFEARPCPLGIPTPNDITITDPTVADDSKKKPGVLYADQQYSHFGLVELNGGSLTLSLVREDGAAVFTRRFD
jgi:hypothetical protein